MAAKLRVVSRGLDAREAADFLGISERWFHKRVGDWIEAGTLEPVQPGGQGRIYYGERQLERLRAQLHALNVRTNNSYYARIKAVQAA